MKNAILTAALAVAVYSAPTLAQEQAPQLRPGARVRLSLPVPALASTEERNDVRGTYVGADSASLFVATRRDTIAIPRARVLRIEMLAGRVDAGAARGRGARRGLVTGLVGGATLMLAAWLADRQDGIDSDFYRQAAIWTGTAGGLGMVGGFLLGGQDTWQRVPPPPLPAPAVAPQQAAVRDPVLPPPAGQDDAQGGASAGPAR
jgi:hypothetical protein